MNAEKPIDLREQVRREMEEYGLSQSQASKESGIEASGSSKLNQWLQGKYSGDNDKIEIQLQRWLAERTEARDARGEIPQAPGWVRTSTAEKIFETLQYAKNAGICVCVHGGAGVGKTCTSEAFKGQYPNVWVVTATPSAQTWPSFLRRIANAVSVRAQSQRTADLEDEVLQRIKGTQGLLIIDEAQLLSNDSLWGIKNLFDMARIGVAYVGSEQLYSNLSGRREEVNAPIFRRISKKQALKHPTKDDVEALLLAWGMKTDAPNYKTGLDYCLKIATKPGALGMLTETLRMASLTGGVAGSGLTYGLIKQSYAWLGGDA